jgi:hypothetical protein
MKKAWNAVCGYMTLLSLFVVVFVVGALCILLIFVLLARVVGWASSPDSWLHRFLEWVLKFAVRTGG